MKLEIIKGVITNKQDMQTVSGRTYQGTGHVRTKHRAVFNIDKQAAELNGTGGMYFNDGDEVLAIGQKAKFNNIFYIACFTNLSTGVVQQSSTIIPSILGACCIFLGVWTFFLIITPILFIPLGLMSLWGAYQGIQANKALKSAIQNN